MPNRDRYKNSVTLTIALCNGAKNSVLLCGGSSSGRLTSALYLHSQLGWPLVGVEATTLPFRTRHSTFVPCCEFGPTVMNSSLSIPVLTQFVSNFHLSFAFHNIQPVNPTAAVAPHQTVDSAAKTVEKMEASTKVTPDDITKAKEKYTKAKAEQAGIKSKYEGRSVGSLFFFCFPFLFLVCLSSFCFLVCLSSF
jgi:hypothetical protein